MGHFLVSRLRPLEPRLRKHCVASENASLGCLSTCDKNAFRDGGSITLLPFPSLSLTSHREEMVPPSSLQVVVP